MKTIILILISFFLISCGGNGTNNGGNGENGENGDNGENGKESQYTISNNTEEAVVQITYQSSTKEVPVGKCLLVSESQFKTLEVIAKGTNSQGNKNDTSLCSEKKACEPDNYSVTDDEILGGFLYDTYEITSSAKATGECLTL